MKKTIIVYFVYMILIAMAFAERVPGTRVILTPPDHFVKAEQFPGYIMQEQNASIVITEIPGPFTEVTEGFNSDALASKGMVLLEKKVIKTADPNMLLFHFSQRINDIEFLKWLCAIGDQSETVFIMATFPKIYEEDLSLILKKAILTATLDKDLQTDFWEGVTFRVANEGKLKIAPKKMGNTIFLTVDGVFPKKSKDDPMVIVGSSMSKDLKVHNKESFAVKRLMQMAYMTNIEILTNEKATFDELYGVRIHAKAIDSETKKERFIYHVVLYTEDGYYIFQGNCSLDERNEYSAIFDKILKSFKRVGSSKKEHGTKTAVVEPNSRG